MGTGTSCMVWGFWASTAPITPSLGRCFQPALQSLPLFTAPLLTAHTVSGGCGSLRVGGCVPGPFWGVCVSTPDQTPTRHTSQRCTLLSLL